MPNSTSDVGSQFIGGFSGLRARFEIDAHPAVRVVLGHFFFLYFQPYMDGNGRIARFLMNVVMAASGYPWIVIPVGERNHYMTALERASAGADIVPFTEFLGGLAKHRLAGDPPPKVPSSSRGNTAVLDALAAVDQEVDI